MKIEGIHHVAVVTSDIQKTMDLYKTLFEVEIEEPKETPDQGIIGTYVPMTPGIEIMQPTDPEGGIQKFIDKHGEGIHHIAVKVKSIEAAVEELKAQGVRLILGTADGNIAAFIHPKATGGVLVELCE